MHRTQLLLETWQYEALKARARREGKSLSEWVRRMLRSVLSPSSTTHKRSPKGLWAVCGVGRDPTGPPARDHDRILYRQEGGK